MADVKRGDQYGSGFGHIFLAHASNPPVGSEIAVFDQGSNKRVPNRMLAAHWVDYGGAASGG